ncbi:MAG: DUF6291 domain-containing protein [Oscillospiraceae bacterium]|nr:DUF6291 domain-containing protein [Oscillospiraceae bacterium]
MANKKKKSFMFYYDYAEYFELLDDHEAAALIKALITYAKNGSEPRFKDKLLVAFTAIRMQIDRDSRKYEETCRKNKETAVKRESNRRKKEKETSDDSFFYPDEARSCTNSTDKDKDKEKENENDNDKDKDKDKETLPLIPPQGETVIEGECAYINACGEKKYYFDEFWEMYPKKVGKHKTLLEWERIAPDTALAHEICRSLLRHRSCDQWEEQNGRFIPYPYNWLSERHWEDEVTVSPVF